MTIEQFTNLAQTTLAAAITSPTSTSITVTSATSFPSVSQFHIVIDQEIMVVTGGAGTTTWTVTRGDEGTTAATHANSALVTLVLTAGSLQEFGNNLFAQSLARTTAISDPTALTFGSPVARLRPIELVSPELRVCSKSLKPLVLGDVL